MLTARHVTRNLYTRQMKELKGTPALVPSPECRKALYCE